MPRRKRSEALAQGETALRAARQVLAQLQAEKAASRKVTDKQRRAIQRAKDAELRAQARELRAYGLYETKGPELTRGRKQRIRAAHLNLEHLKRTGVYAPKPKGRAARRQVEGIVRRHGGKVTKKGVFVQRSEGEMGYRPGETPTRLIRDRETGLWYIEQTRRGKIGTVRSEIYLDDIEALQAQEANLRKRFDRLERDLTKDERIRFTIGGPNGNVSTRSFRTWPALRTWVMAYRRDPRAQATFMAGLTLYVVQRETPGARTWRVPVAWADRRGRRHDAAADMLIPGGLFPTRKARRRKSQKGRKPGKP